MARDESVERKEEGYCVEEVEEKFSKIEIRTMADLRSFVEALERCPFRRDFP
jgi:hypothetical protein